MSEESHALICPACGARANAGSQQCELCGSEFGGNEPEQIIPDRPPAEPESKKGQRDPVVCVACGQKNRSTAIFCDQCATPLERSASAPKPVPAKPPRSKARKRADKSVPKTVQPSESKPRVGLLLAGGVILVAALYGITVLSKSSPSATTVQPAVQNTSTNPDDYLPEDSELANQSRDILAAAANETDDSRVIDLRSQLVALYADNGRLDLAGREMGLVAERLNTADSWAQAGNLHFDWMEQQSGNERLQASKRASVAYEKSLTLDPENLDVRTDLGVAYLNDPASPMPAIRETNAVLEADSNHVQANFNKGVMLLQIGRNADAIRLFEKVKSLTDPESAAYERANVILDQIRSEGG